MSRIRIGIVGAGFGASSHLPALQHHPKFEVVAIASPARAERVAKETGVPHAFRSGAEMLAECELAAVAITSPPFTHHKEALAALAAGKHVLCEKPFALDVVQAESMRAAAANANTACGVAHEFRFVPQIQALKELAVNGHLGPLRNLEITHFRPSLRRDVARARSWWFERERGGGLAGAVLSHFIDQANWLIGAVPSSAQGFRRTANPQRHDEHGEFFSDVDDGVCAVLEYGSDIIARLCADGTVAVASHTTALHGETRTGVASGPTITDVTLYAVDGETTEELICKPSPYAGFARINENVPLLMELYDEFANAIDGKPNALPSFDDALATQRVLAAVGYGA